MLNFFRSEGLRLIESTLWVSDLESEELDYIADSLPIHPSSQYRVCVIQLNNFTTCVPNLQVIHGEEFAISRHNINLTLNGRYLWLAAGFSNESDLNQTIGIVESSVIIALRTLLGNNSAVQKVYRFRYDLETRLSHLMGNMLLAWPDHISGVGDPTALIRSGAIFPSFQRPSFNAATQILLMQALETQDVAQRFIFLWFAVESEIGRGKDRENFANRVAKNSIERLILSKEMLDLFALRNKYAHEGISEIEISDVYSLQGILKLRSLEGTGAAGQYLKYLTSHVFGKRRPKKP
ncbi:hypothetical protein [Rubellimicrobium mesophilum]|uniref:hypothetical protein n=1 Tax=Rubellimicrobium mesophilum TaxID=1123067 RepID=UPI0012E1D314|nr:hypothetical protein [Rubellimicrobium mesophilum]